MKELIGRLLQVDMLNRIAATFRTQNSANPCTEQYPLEMIQDFKRAHYRRQGAMWDRRRLEEGRTPMRCMR